MVVKRKDVRVITFDELLEMLKMLRESLTGKRYVSEIDDDETDWSDIIEEDLERDDPEGPDDEDRDPRD